MASFRNTSSPLTPDLCLWFISLFAQMSRGVLTKVFRSILLQKNHFDKVITRLQSILKRLAFQIEVYQVRKKFKALHISILKICIWNYSVMICSNVLTFLNMRLFILLLISQSSNLLSGFGVGVKTLSLSFFILDENWSRLMLKWWPFGTVVLLIKLANGTQDRGKLVWVDLRRLVGDFIRQCQFHMDEWIVAHGLRCSGSIRDQSSNPFAYVSSLSYPDNGSLLNVEPRGW